MKGQQNICIGWRFVKRWKQNSTSEPGTRMVFNGNMMFLGLLLLCIKHVPGPEEVVVKCTGQKSRSTTTIRTLFWSHPKILYFFLTNLIQISSRIIKINVFYVKRVNNQHVCLLQILLILLILFTGHQSTSEIRKWRGHLICLVLCFFAATLTFSQDMCGLDLTCLRNTPARG